MKSEKLPSGNWRVRVYLGETEGKKKWKSVTGKTRQEAMRKASLFLPVEEAEMSVLEAFRAYIEAKGPVLSPETVRGYQKITRCHLEGSSIATIRLEKLTTALVQRWISDLTTKMAPKSVRNCYGLLTAAVMMFLPDARFRVKLPQRKKAELYTPSTEDVNAVITAADPELRKAIGLAINAMMRRGEICALTTKDIDFLRGTVSITKSMARTSQGEYVIKPPKTNSSNRTVAINRELLELLPKSGPVVDLTPDQITMRFNRAIKKAGLPSFRFHDLRHYAASIAVSSAIGAGKLTIQGRGGWQSDHVLKSVYEHSIKEQEDRDTASILSFYSRNIRFGG